MPAPRDVVTRGARPLLTNAASALPWILGVALILIPAFGPTWYNSTRPSNGKATLARDRAASLLGFEFRVEAADVVELRASAALPAHIAGAFEEPIGYQELADGRQIVFDRRGHAVYVIDAGRTAATKIVQVGGEEGRVLAPVAFDVAPDGTFVVADAPNRRERIQHFDVTGKRLGGFTLPGRAEPRVAVGSLVLNGIGSLQFTGTSILINQPETGAVITEYALNGYPVRSIGRLRPTGHEDDRALNLALNTGLPLVAPDGGFFFVFQTGEPVFRKYDRRGNLEFERLVQGRDLDDFVRALPQSWPSRRAGSQELPLVPPTIRSASLDRTGALWLSFAVPVTYRYDRDGDRVGAYRFRAAGPLQPASLHFADRGRLLVTPGLHEFTVP